MTNCLVHTVGIEALVALRNLIALRCACCPLFSAVMEGESFQQLIALQTGPVLKSDELLKAIILHYSKGSWTTCPALTEARGLSF